MSASGEEKGRSRPKLIGGNKLVLLFLVIAISECFVLLLRLRPELLRTYNIEIERHHINTNRSNDKRNESVQDDHVGSMGDGLSSWSDIFRAIGLFDSDFQRAATSPMPTYTRHLAKDAIRPSTWRCSSNSTSETASNKNHTIFAFVHIYKTAGTTMRRFFHEFAYTCHKTWISLAKCTGVRPSSIRSRGIWRPCIIEEVADGRNRQKAHFMDSRDEHYYKRSRPAYAPLVNGENLGRLADIIGGHARIGTGDHIFPTSSSSSPVMNGEVRHIVFLCDPMERLVSGVLYQNKLMGRNETLDHVVAKIKARIADNSRKNIYWDKSLSYLLTPAQRVENERLHIEEKLRELNNTSDSMIKSVAAETRAKLAIQNLYDYNAIIGMTERMSESLEILKHALLNKPDDDIKKEADDVFAKFSPTGHHAPSSNNSDTGGIRANKSSQRVSTSAVIAELAKDAEHMRLFEEHVKYERMITEFAWTMHHLQYDAVVGAVG